MFEEAAVTSIWKEGHIAEYLIVWFASKLYTKFLGTRPGNLNQSG